MHASSRPLDALVGRSSAESFVGLIYHRVGGRSPSAVDLPAATFARQLDLLSERRVVSLDEALRTDAPASTAPARAPAVVLTFDDGTADWPEVVMPMLLERGLPATFYVSTDFVERQRPFPDDGRPVSWAGLADMLGTGLVTIGSHTHTHRVMAGLTTQQAIAEVDRAIELIENRLGVTPAHFAYPKAVAPSPAADVVVRRRHASAVLAGNRAAHAGADTYRLGRHAVTVADDERAFQRKVAGGHVLEGWLRERRDSWAVRSASPA